MKTKKVYYAEVYLKNLTAKVIETLPCPGEADSILVVLDQTIFFPEGGGQSCDIGTINDCPVTHVSETKDSIYHKLSLAESPIKGISTLSDDEFLAACGKLGLTPGSDVNLTIDWERRFDNMQRHCGEHILSGIFYKLFGGVNRGFHMGEDYLTIDISLEDKPEYKELTIGMCLQAELMANQAIWDNLPVVRRIFDSRDEAEKMPLRKALAIDEDISIVTIGDINDPADSVACCGTHPEFAGQVGMIKIYKVEPNKGMFRIFFEAGKRALLAYDKHYEVMTKIGNDLSAGVPDLMDKYNARNEKNKEIRDRLYGLTKEVIRREGEYIKALLSDDSGHAERDDTKTDAQAARQSNTQTATHETPFEFTHTGNLSLRYNLLTVDDIIELGRSLAGSLNSMLFLIHKPSLTVFLFSDKYDCGKLVKDNVTVFNGKGGGNKTFARAIFTRRDDLDAFIQAIDMLTKQ